MSDSNVGGCSPVSFREIDAVLVVSPPTVDEKVTFNELIMAANPEQEIRVTSGQYFLAEPIHVDKPLKIIAAKPGKVTITGEKLEHLSIINRTKDLLYPG